MWRFAHARAGCVGQPLEHGFERVLEGTPVQLELPKTDVLTNRDGNPVGITPIGGVAALMVSRRREIENLLGGRVMMARICSERDQAG
jgi:hypothetical protein